MPAGVKHCAVLGSPIAHSLSPVMHRVAYAELGLDWSYEAVEVDESGLATFLAGLDADWRGLSLTMPLKRVALDLVDRCSEVATAVGAVNTIVLGPDEGRGTGDNTDVPGALAALREHGLDDLRTARIIGGGATATSIGHALATAGVTDLEIVVREVSKASATAEAARAAGAHVAVQSLEEPFLEKVDIVVSTVPGEAVRSRLQELVRSARAVFDVAYEPWPGPIVTAAEQGGLPAVSGLDLLAHQAALQVQLMTGSSIEPDLLRKSALASLLP
ncbi:shikimate dehydrogenase [Aeromicrobium sp.]|uniref:shikimate dehydrogenase n=1 Tax=Aeromicrobium sp. TaxID=1871063 RepID=UPI003D6A9C44